MQDDGESIEVRQAAGILLKNNLRTTFSSMPSPSQQYIKAELLPCIGATNRAIRSTVGTVISVLFQIVRVAGWIELFQALHKCLDSNDLDHMEGAMDAIYKICEDVPEELDVDVPGLSERPINVFMPRILQFFQSPHASLRKLALGCTNQYIVLMPSALYMSMDQYLLGLFNLAKDPSADVRKLVCSAWVQLIQVRPSILEPHLKNVTELILLANKDSDDEVALEACEFWSAYCDVSMPPEGLREFLPRLIPTLLSNMVYADDDESLADAEEEESFPDRDQDLKPRFHASRLHGSETGEDDDYDDAVNVWNLRKCSAAGLDVLSNVFGDSILPTLMPLIEQNLARTDDESWKERETAVLSLGAIAEGCIAGLYPHLPQIVAFLIPLLDDKFPLIRSITCWTLSRYSKFIVQSLDHPNGREQFDKILSGLLRRILDTNKRVQEAACSAFTTFEEEAAEELVPHLEVILQHLMCAYGKYQRRNLRILYDALGTLADAVGAELNQAKYLDIFMPPLIMKWQELQNSDKDLFPLLECFTSIAQALGPGFAQFAEPVFQRRINLIQSQQLAKGYYRRGASYLAMGKFKEALKDFQQEILISSGAPARCRLDLRSNSSWKKLLKSYNKGPAGVRSTICRTMVSLALKEPRDNWGPDGIVRWINNEMKAEPNLNPVLLHLLELLPKEINNFEASPKEKRNFETKLFGSAKTVTEILESCLESCLYDDELREQIYESFVAWHPFIQGSKAESCHLVQAIMFEMKANNVLESSEKALRRIRAGPNNTIGASSSYRTNDYEAKKLQKLHEHIMSLQEYNTRLQAQLNKMERENNISSKKMQLSTGVSMSASTLKDLNISQPVDLDKGKDDSVKPCISKPVLNGSKCANKEENAPSACPDAVTNGNEAVIADVEYIDSENLVDLPDVDATLSTLVKRLDSKDWIMTCEALNNVRQLAIYHKERLQELLKPLVPLIVKSVKNPRSAVCKTALMTCADIFKAYGDLMVDSVDPLLVQLFLKASQDKRFVCEAAEAALISMTNWISPSLLLPRMQPYLKNRNPRIRAKASVCFSKSVPRLDVEGIKEYGMDKLIQIAATQLSDQLPESREAARNLALELQVIYEKSQASTSGENEGEPSASPDAESWEAFCQSKLSALSAQAILRVTSTTPKDGVTAGVTSAPKEGVAVGC